MMIKNVENSVKNVEKEDKLQFMEVMVNFNESTGKYNVLVYVAGYDNSSTAYYNEYETRKLAITAQKRLITTLNKKYPVSIAYPD